MKIFNIVKIGLSACIMAFIGISCNGYEKEKLDVITEKDVWEAENYTGDYILRRLNGIYACLPELHGAISNSLLDVGTDDAVPSEISSPQMNIEAFITSQISPANLVDSKSWANNYNGIRRATALMNNIYKNKYVDKGILDNWYSVAKFLRAFFYFDLLKKWGGVPILEDKLFNINEPIQKERSSIDEVVRYILKELDESREHLVHKTKLDNANIGQPTQESVDALRAKLLLYYASPLFNPENDQTRWKAAADAAKVVVESSSLGFENDYRELFLKLKDNAELIFVREVGKGVSIANAYQPVGYHKHDVFAYGLVSPSQGLVDAFPMKNGKSISSPNSGYNPQDPYKNRDPRLDLVVFRNEQKWLNRNVEIYEGGLDKPNLPELTQTRTGYYLKKFLHNSETSGAQNTSQHRSFFILRYTDIVLGYIEALNEYDPGNGDIYKYLISIRKRGGIDSGDDGRYGVPSSMSQDVAREFIRNERRIELCFEENRFFDIRRWKIASDVLNRPIKGVKIIKEGETFKYEYTDVLQGKFEQKNYWYPFSRSEMESNPLLEQNPGWEY